MRVSFVLPLALAAGVAGTVSAQGTPRARILQLPGARSYSLATEIDPHAVIGVTLGGSGSSRDTLGVLIASVTPGGPADRAGIEEGSRLASINGVSLRVSPSDAGDPEMSGIMQRRLTRELGKVKPGDEVELRVYNSGQTRTVRVKTASSDELYRSPSRRMLDDRPSLGFGVGSTGSRRDTLGVLVMYVSDSGPAAKAGMEEGNRIAAINGIDLRVSPTDAGDDYIANARMRRLQREIGVLKPGDDVELRVYQNGSFRNIRLRAVRASELPRRRSVFIFGDGASMALPSVPIAPDDWFDGSAMRDDIRRAIERAMEAAGTSLEGVGRALDGVGRGLNRTRIRWNDDDGAEAMPSPSTRTPSPSGRTLAPARRTYRTASGAAGQTVTAEVAATPGDADVLVAPAVAAAGFPSTFAYSSDAVAVDFAGLKLALVDHELADYLGEGSEAGLLVTGVPAWAEGLRKGDVILRIDGRSVRAGDETTLEFGDARTATFDVLRKGERTKVAVTLPR